MLKTGQGHKWGVITAAQLILGKNVINFIQKDCIHKFLAQQDQIGSLE